MFWGTGSLILYEQDLLSINRGAGSTILINSPTLSHCDKSYACFIAYRNPLIKTKKI